MFLNTYLLSKPLAAFISMQRLSDRLSSLNKATLPEKDKNKRRTVFTKEFMSSEETTSDADGEDTLLLKQPMPWRSDKVTTFFYDLDKHKETVKSSQSKRLRFVPVRTKCLLVLYLTKSGQLYVIHSSPLDLLPLTFERNSIDYLVLMTQSFS